MATTVWDDPGQRVNVSGTRVTEAELSMSGMGPREGNWVVCNEDVSLCAIVVGVCMILPR
jgi:hypothetical protein